MCQYGFERMNLRKLAKESGIQAGSLYNYFSSKDEFLYKVICDIMSDLLEDIDENLKGVNKPAVSDGKKHTFHTENSGAFPSRAMKK